MKRILEFIKKEAVLCASGVLAAVSCFVVPPSAKYFDYIDLRVLGLLFCLMAVVAGIRATGAFDVVCEGLLRRLRSIKAVGLALVWLSFFVSMLLTNDVALVTLVPFTLLLFESIKGEKKSRAEIVLLVLETAAANLGSMLTPMGNPQNLYLYSKFNLTVSQFFAIIFPYSALALVLLTASVFLFLPRLQIEKPSGSARLNGRLKAVLFLILFAVCMLSILRILDYRILLVIIVIAVLILDRKLLLKVDYSLLLTFVFFFIFVGNLGSIPALSESLRSVLQGREVWLGIALSQVISNVPAAILLSGLSENAAALIIGTNLGGLGTLIASMASLITYKFYAASKGGESKRYMLVFTIFNLAYLALMCGLYAIIN